ncbi:MULTISPECIES: class I SAM-dependent methyltransferase [unclassified Phenylobacterium]|uniref:class I SAM-dependent methyltransferase n=1 Tax=unclassified Phenylobacterium TaxID=2640670 RepID=UPI00083B1601|nr:MULTISPECIES: class I SAM-dependent methyltransferase [unclassified Phenylobacterium]
MAHKGEADGVLIFPAGMPDGLAFRDRARALGLRVVGASSVHADPARDAYDAWEALPYVSDPGFDAALAAVVKRHDIGAIHAPHFVVWRHLSERLHEIAPGARLSGDDRPEDHERAYRDLRTRMSAPLTFEFAPAFPPQPPLSLVELAGLVRLVDTIPGMCAEHKMRAIVEVMRHAPRGDVVEIGSWWGRSAALFVWLARRYDIGDVLCVDPWMSDAMPQGDALLDKTSADLDTEEALRMFEINLAPLAAGRLNYVRARAENAAGSYGPGLKVRTEAFGETSYEGRIAVLHIDGNHAEHHAALDTALWTPHVVPGGWIIFDDYDWAFGDGPKKVADAFVSANEARIATVFQAGPSLFLQLKDDARG